MIRPLWLLVALAGLVVAGCGSDDAPKGAESMDNNFKGQLQSKPFNGRDGVPGVKKSGSAADGPDAGSNSAGTTTG